ncbi:hypothetical protein C8R45DRAFT_957954 [Mycena sanguinolenta]|nr:hypothetical protein C8R45DRAFT_957954 [Mycena sanguinolenta]
MSIDKFLAPHSPQARAHFHATENGMDWDISAIGARVEETIVAHCAAYRSFERYLSGEHIFIFPTTRRELESILRRYSTDAIHNAIAKSRGTLEPGGYSRLCHLAIDSIDEVLNTGDNVAYLLALHAPKDSSPRREESPTRPIRTT